MTGRHHRCGPADASFAPYPARPVPTPDRGAVSASGAIGQQIRPVGPRKARARGVAAAHRCFHTKAPGFTAGESGGGYVTIVCQAFDMPGIRVAATAAATATTAATRQTTVTA